MDVDLYMELRQLNDKIDKLLEKTTETVREEYLRPQEHEEIQQLDRAIDRMKPKISIKRRTE